MTTLGPDATVAGRRTAPEAAPPNRRRRTAPAVALLVPVVPVVLAIVLRRDRWLLTSDSVAQQSVVRTWFALGHERTFLPPDTWLLKVPLYVLVEALPLAPAARVLVESLALAAATVALLGWACWSLAGQAGLERTRRPLHVALPFAWLGTLAGGLGGYLTMMPNARNIELGLGLVVVALAGRRLSWPARPPRRPVAAAEAAAVAIVLGVIWVDDPYVAALVGLPLAVAALAWFGRRRDRGGRDRRLLALAAVLLASLALVPVLRGLLAAVGVEVVPDGTAPTLDPAQVFAHVRLLGPAAAAELGLPENGSAASAAHALALVLLAVAVAASVAVTVRGWRLGRLAVTFLGVHWLVVVAGVLVDRTVYDFHVGRYLVLAFVDLAACLALAPALLAERRTHRWAARPATALPVVIAVAVALNLVSAARDTPIDPALVRAQRLDQERTLALLTAAAGGARSEAFGPFWTADLYTQLSGGRLQVAEVVCDEGRLRRRRWLTDTAREDVRAGRAVVVVPPAAPELAGCTSATISDELGGASQRLTTPAGTVVLVFDHDVAPGIGPA